MYIKKIWSAWLIFYIAITSIHFIIVNPRDDKMHSWLNDKISVR